MLCACYSAAGRRRASSRGTTLREGMGMVVVEWCTLQAAAPRTSTRTHAQTSRQTQHERKDEWTGGSIGTHAHAHAHAYRRARPGSTLHRRRARVRGTAVCRRTGYLGPRRPRWRWARAYMSNARPVWPAMARPKRLIGQGWAEPGQLTEASGEPAGRSVCHHIFDIGSCSVVAVSRVRG